MLISRGWGQAGISLGQPVYRYRGWYLATDHLKMGWWLARTDAVWLASSGKGLYSDPPWPTLEAALAHVEMLEALTP